MTRATAAVLTVLLLAGCRGAADPVPADRYYRLAVPMPAAADPASLRGTVMVGRLDADGLMRERPMVYSLDQDARSLSQDVYDLWVEPPARLLQAQLVDYLRGAGVAGSVVTPELRVRPDFEVVGTIRRFERLLGEGGPKVAVALELALVDLNGDRLRVVDTYAVEIACDDTSVDASVGAFNQALATVFAGFVADMRR